MSTNWVKDIAEMHAKFGVNIAIDALSDEMFKELIALRSRMLQEELNEFTDAISNKDPAEMTDALIDLIVFAIGTLNVANVDANKTWDNVLEKNMEKSPGIKPGRPNPFKLPDLIKPFGWTAPDHNDNVGRFDIFRE